MGAKLDLTGQKPYRLTAIEDTGKRISRHWRKHRTLPDFVFIAMRNRAIADLDAAHERAENEQP